MKRFLFALAAVTVMLVGTSFTNSASAHGPGWGGGCGPHRGYGYGGGYGPGYSSYRPSYGYGGYGGGYGGYGAYGYPVVYPGYGSYGYANHGVIQIYGARGGFTFGY